MMAVAVILLLLALAGLLAAVGSLIFPPIARKLGARGRLGGFVRGLAAGLVLLVLAGMIAPTQPGTDAAPTSEATAPAPVGPPASVEAAAPAQPAGHPLPVRLRSLKPYERQGRLRITAELLPTGDQQTVTQADLAATVMAACERLAAEKSAQVVTVKLFCQEAANSYGEPQLAYAVYIPDGKGIDGKTSGPVWQTLDAAPRGFSPQELQYLRLWAELRGQFQTPDGLTDEPRLKAAIASRMGIEDGSLKPHLNLREPVQPVRVEGKLEISATRQ